MMHGTWSSPPALSQVLQGRTRIGSAIGSPVLAIGAGLVCSMLGKPAPAQMVRIWGCVLEDVVFNVH